MTDSLLGRLEARMRTVPTLCEAGKRDGECDHRGCVEFGWPDYPALARAAAEVCGEEMTRLRDWVGDLQSGLYINCVYCGFRYGPGESTPATLPEAGETLAATALREHVSKCPEHPMSRLRAERDALRAALEGLGAKPDGYCFCLDQAQINDGHTGECLEAKKALGEPEP